jgi:protoporphyrinogen IX oxidase
MASYYLWIKAFHVIAVIAWMAGLFYLPRLFVYHATAEIGSAKSETFKVMERRLLKAIMTPAMVASWVLGLALIHILDGFPGWLAVKLAAVVPLTAFHLLLARYVRQFAEDQRPKTERCFRIINEAPTLLMIVIVIMVVVKPF